MTLFALVLVTLALTQCEAASRVLGSCWCGLENKQIDSRIVGGREAVANNYPWQVAFVERNNFTYCGGSLINSQYVVTAAHCVDNQLFADLRVSLGQHTRSKVGQVVAINAFWIHQGYERNSSSTRFLYDDIAVVRLSQPIAFIKSVAPICLPTSWMTATFSDGSLFASGWGRTSKGDDSKLSETLQVTEFNEVPYEQSRALWGRAATRNHVFVNAPGKDVGSGDSGGPLVYKYGPFNFLAGAASFTGAANKMGAGAAYTRITPYIDWIRQIVTDGDYCTHPYSDGLEKEFGK